jgi:hypothetical protein
LQIEVHVQGVRVLSKAEKANDQGPEFSDDLIIEIADASLRRLVGVEHHAAGNRSLAWATEPEEPLDG